MKLNYKISPATGPFNLELAISAVMIMISFDLFNMQRGSYVGCVLLVFYLQESSCCTSLYIAWGKQRSEGSRKVGWNAVGPQTFVDIHLYIHGKVRVK